MTEGNYRKNIMVFAFPLLLSQVFQQLYNTADSLMVGNFLGKEALAAVSSSGNLIFLLTSFFIGLSAGAGIVISRHFGAKHYRRLSLAIHTDLMLGITAGLFLTLSGVIFSPHILRAMGTAPSVLPLSVKYFRFYFLGGIFIVLYNTCSGIMNALGDSKRSLRYLMISSVLNILLDYLFIGVMGLGVEWAAIATTISLFVSVFLSFKYLMKEGTIFQVRLSKIRFDSAILKQILHLGLPAGVQNSVIGFANVIVQSNINSFGADAMAGYGVFAKLEGMAFLPINSFAMAVSTFVSQNMGAKKIRRAKEGSNFGILFSMLLSELIGVIFFFLIPRLMTLFTKDPNVIHFGTMQAQTVAFFFFLLTYSHLVAAACRGAGRSVVPMLVMLFVWCFLRIAYITWIMDLIHDIRFVYWAYPLTWSISSVIYFIYLKKSDMFKETKTSLS